MFRSSNTSVRFFASDVGCMQRETRLIFLKYTQTSMTVLRGENVIGEVLKRLRTIYGYKAIDVSGKLGISASYLSEIENGKKQPSLEHLKKYAELFGIRLSSLILLSESYEEAEKEGKGSALIRAMMINLINGMSKNAEGLNESN